MLEIAPPNSNTTRDGTLDNVERHYPARHYVVVDDKIRILDAAKKAWGSRVTTIFPRQGHYARDPRETAKYPPADITLDHIGDFLDVDLSCFTSSTDRARR